MSPDCTHADVPLFGQITIEPIAAGDSFVDEGEMSAFGLELADERVDVTLARAYGADIDDLGVVFLGDVGYLWTSNPT